MSSLYISEKNHTCTIIGILTFYLYTSYSWNETFTNSAKLFAVLVAALSSVNQQINKSTNLVFEDNVMYVWDFFFYLLPMQTGQDEKDGTRSLTLQEDQISQVYTFLSL